MRSLFPSQSTRQPSAAGLLAILFTCAGWFLITPASHAETLSEAEVLYQTGEYQKCIEVAEAGIAGSPFSSEWRIWKLRAEMAIGRYDDALATVEEAKKISSRNLRLLWMERDVRRFNDQSAKAKEVLAEIAAQIERTSGMYRDSQSMVIIGKFFLEVGADPKQVRLDLFKQVQQRAPNSPDAYIAAGELALAKNDFALAAEDLQKALKLDEKNPRILYGLARSFEPSDSEKAEQFVKQALEANPSHVPSLLLVAENHLIAERYEETEALISKVLEINPAEPDAWALRAVLAHLASDADHEAECRKEALKHWTDNPHVDYLIGKFLARKYRFAEAAAAQRKSLSFQSDYLPAKMELANDLLRLGDVEKGWQLAEEVFDADNYNVVAHNLSTLREHMAKFRTLRADGFVVRMDAEEAEIYGPRVLELLQEAKQLLCEKYDVELPETVAVEIFPKQQDFAIRTFGLPGGAGFLGVCFGNVITMNSPASQSQNPSNWEAVLWHEFCHVVTLTKTKNKMPRWLSEGISVYEERLRNPSWGQAMSPAYRQMILGEDLTPVSVLSAAFLRPPSPRHLMFAYYESAIAVEFIVDKFGQEALRNILDELANGLQINDAIARHAAPLDAIDAGFEQYIREKATAFAEKASFETDELPEGNDLAEWKAWVENHPDNFPGLQRYAIALIQAEKWQEALAVVDQLRKLEPDFAGEGSALAMKARISRELSETETELEVLNEIAVRQSDALEVYKRLADIYSEQENWSEVGKNAQRILAVNPLNQEPYHLLAKAGEATHDAKMAINGLTMLARLDPVDPADIHYRAARWLAKADRRKDARRHVLLALEEAPRYRDAHHLLLSLVAENSPTEEQPSQPPTEETE